MIEVNTTLKFEDKEKNEKKSYFEMVYATIIKVSDEIKEKKELEKIILSDLQTKIYPDLEKALLDLLYNSGYPGIKFEKKIDFENLYNQRFN
jgi:preprotein translocase subunit SecB